MRDPEARVVSARAAQTPPTHAVNVEDKADKYPYLIYRSTLLRVVTELLRSPGSGATSPGSRRCCLLPQWSMTLESDAMAPSMSVPTTPVNRTRPIVSPRARPQSMQSSRRPFSNQPSPAAAAVQRLVQTTPGMAFPPLAWPKPLEDSFHAFEASARPATAGTSYEQRLHSPRGSTASAVSVSPTGSARAGSSRNELTGHSLLLSQKRTFANLQRRCAELERDNEWMSERIDTLEYETRSLRVSSNPRPNNLPIFARSATYTYRMH